MLPHDPTPRRWQKLVSLALPLALTAAALHLAFGALRPAAAGPAPSPIQSPTSSVSWAGVTPPDLANARYWGTLTDATRGVAIGDMNGDDALDLVVVNYNQQSAVYFNDGKGNFYSGAVDCEHPPLSVSCFGGADPSTGVAVGDLNGDGALDIVVANSGQVSLVYLNAGRGDFYHGALDCLRLSVTCFGGEATRSVAVADLDGDGKLDVVAGNNLAASKVYFGDGSGGVRDQRTFGGPADPTASVGVGDVNGDGAIDIVAGNYGAQSRVYLNDGAGNFISTRNFGGSSDLAQGLALGDFNLDGALDIGVGRRGQLSAVYLNDGTGNFPAGQPFGSADQTQSLAVGDVNGDGALDIVVGNDRQQNQVYLNDGAGTFAVALPFDTGANATRAVAVADVNGDGTLDLIIGNEGQPNTLYLNEDGGDFPSGAAFQRPFGTSSTAAVAIGDLNGDGALDIAVGNKNTGDSNTLYFNDGAGNFIATGSFGTGTDSTQGLAAADLNGDGTLDLTAANFGRQSRVYLNNGHGQFTTTRNFGGSNDPTRSVALGDLDGDGALDIVVGNDSQPNMIYLNDGAGNFTKAVVLDSQAYNTRSIAAGDFNGDGAVDVVVGDYGQPDLIYLNDGAAHFTFAQSLGLPTNKTVSVAVADVNGDGAPDIITGNENQPSVVYLNDSTGHFPQTSAYLRYFGTGTDNTRSVAPGDLNGDGWPDIVVGNAGGSQQDAAYLNDGAGNFTRGRNFGSAGNNTYSVALGDMNGDGALDIAAGNYGAGQQNMVYLNGLTGGVRSFSQLPRVSLTRLQPLANVNFAYGSPAQRAMTAPITFTLLEPAGHPANVQAFYSLDGGGQWRPAVAAGGTPTHNLSTRNLVAQTRSITPNKTIADISTITSSLAITAPGLISDVNVWAGISHTATQQLVVTLTAPFNQSVKLIDQRGGSANFGTAVFDDQAATSIVTALAPFSGSYRPEQFLSRLNGSPAVGNWVLSVSDLTANVTGTLDTWGITVTLNTGVIYTYNWDIAASGVFGQSDNAVFRLQATSTFTPTAWSIAGPYQQPYAAAQSFPFRVRGTQVRVLNGASPVSGGLVYRLPAGETGGGALLTDRTGQPFHTDGLGYLQGRGQLDPGDQLLALAPITGTDTYTLYYTSGAPTATGVSAYTVSPGGLQDLTVSANNPLVLFDLSVSLEWDAHTDPSYLDQLGFYLQRASEYLYNFTDGQAALGKVTVYQNADQWAYSHVVIQTNNRLRPFAIQGGVVDTSTPDVQWPDIGYTPGQVTIGATWNRYGNPEQSKVPGDDWSLILAHELSHYLFYEDDAYLGLDANNRLVPVNTCQGSAMGDLYDKPDNFNFIADQSYWNSQCQNTLADLTLHRTEWTTLKLWYPQMVTPTVRFDGPTDMPFGFTTVDIQSPLTPTNALADPTFYIDYVNSQISSSEARAYLLRNNSYVINLGSPYGGQNRVLARGAEPGDRLCVFDRALAQFGCQTVSVGVDQLQMKQDTTWNPVIQFTPVNSRTLTLQVSGLPDGLPLSARIYPDLGMGEAPILLTAVLSGSLTYSGTLTLSAPAMSGHIQVWVDEPATDTNPRREAVVPYSVVGNLDLTESGGELSRLGGSLARTGIARMRLCRGPTRPGGAPVISPDGQMIFYTPNPVDFAPGTFFAIQAMAGLPTLPPGRTLVGQGYNLVASPRTVLPAGSVSLQYLSDEVTLAGADERDLTLYHYNGSAWVMLDTVRDEATNLVSAPSQGPGIYALMSSKQAPLYTGWNSMTYLVQTSRPVSVALASISGAYNLVYGYAITDTTDPWKVYAPDAPAWVNDLDVLTYGTEYLINVTKPMTVYFATGPSVQMLLRWPPSTVYGSLRPGNGFSPTVGMTVTAWVNGNLCGQTLTRQAGPDVVYALDILSEDSLSPGCGAMGRTVKFKIGLWDFRGSLEWNNNRIQTLSLGNPFLTFLPMVAR